MKRKKEKYVDWNMADKFSVLVFLGAGFVLLNRLSPNLVTHVIGVCCIIAGVYGSVCILKGRAFLFD